MANVNRSMGGMHTPDQQVWQIIEQYIDDGSLIPVQKLQMALDCVRLQNPATAPVQQVIEQIREILGLGSNE